MRNTLHTGQVETVQRVFSQVDFDRFAALSGDDNPIHVDPAFSARTRFGRTVAHGMLLYSAVSSVLGNRLPGPGTLQIDQELMFPSPTYAGEQVAIQVQISQVHQVNRLASLSTTILRPGGHIGLQGQTTVLLPGTSVSRRQPGAPPGQPAGLAGGPSLKGLKLGERAETARTFSVQDLAEYIDLTGDANPLFADAGFARRIGLEGVIIPGGLLGGLFSNLLGTHLPGQGTNYLKQRFEYPAPAYPGQTLVASVEIVRIRPEKQLVTLRTVCSDTNGGIVCQGEALVLVSDVERDT